MFNLDVFLFGEIGGLILERERVVTKTLTVSWLITLIRFTLQFSELLHHIKSVPVTLNKPGDIVFDITMSCR